MINSRLIKAYPKEMSYIRKSVFMSWVSLLFNILATVFIGMLIEKLYYKTLQISDLLTTALLIFLSIGVRYVSNIKATEYSYHASTGVKVSLRREFYKKLLSLGPKFNSKISTAQITQMGSEGIEQIEIYFSLYLPQFFYSLLVPFTLFIVLSFFSLKVSIILLICVPLIPFSIIAANKIAKRLLSKYWVLYTNLGDNFLDNLNGLTTLKIYQDDGFKNEEMNRDAESFRKITMKVLTMQLNSVTLMDLIAYGGAAVGIIFALLEFQAEKITLWQTVVFVLLAGEFFIPLRLLGSYFHVAMNGIAASKKIFQIIDSPSEKQETEIIKASSLEIKLKDVNFSYTEERKTLQDINLDIAGNSCIAFVGESGCGKSTLASVIMGFQKYEGSILVNGTQLNRLNKTELMKQFNLIKHKNYLFRGSVRDNLRMGKENASDEEMNKALKAVDLDGFVKSSGGLDYELLENASNLSGGQAQRLSLARSILLDAKLYIFDEATSNIDVESEQIIFETLKELRKTKTIIIISHKIASVVACDKLYVMDKGRIVESGTHSELLENKGLYHQFYTKQKDLENITQGKH